MIMHSWHAVPGCRGCTGCRCAPRRRSGGSSAPCSLVPGMAAMPRRPVTAAAPVALRRASTVMRQLRSGFPERQPRPNLAGSLPGTTHRHPAPPEAAARHAARPDRRGQRLPDGGDADAALVLARRAPGWRTWRMLWALINMPFHLGEVMTVDSPGKPTDMQTTDQQQGVASIVNAAATYMHCCDHAHPKGTMRAAATRASRRASARLSCSSSVGLSAPARCACE